MGKRKLKEGELIEVKPSAGEKQTEKVSGDGVEIKKPCRGAECRWEFRGSIGGGRRLMVTFSQAWSLLVKKIVRQYLEKKKKKILGS